MLRILILANLLKFSKINNHNMLENNVTNTIMKYILDKKNMKQHAHINNNLETCYFYL